MGVASPRGATEEPADGSKPKKSGIITVSGIDIGQLHFTREQFKLAINELSIAIRMEDLHRTMAATVDPAAVFASVISGMQAPRPTRDAF